LSNLPSAPLRLLLDGEALVSNWRWLAAQSGAAECGAAVKADGYGLGAREIVARLAKAGCNNFFVAHWREAAAIADLVPPAQIAVLNGFDGDDPADVLQIGALPVLNTPAQISRWKAAGGGQCHIMLDSGINRLGIGPEQITGGLFEGLDIDLLMSHLASADEDVPQNAEQLRNFGRMAAGIKAKRRSFANSAGIMLGRDYRFDVTRPGLSLYGGFQRSEMAGHIRNVARPQASVLQVRTVSAGSAVGYKAGFVCERETRIATLAIGYADGYRRGFSGKGMTRFNGIEMPVLGRVSMDLLIVDASAAQALKEGDWVDVDYDLVEASRISGIGQYELLTGLGHRAERIWS
jgi:alanine racemase